MSIEYVGMEELLRRTLRSRADTLHVGGAPAGRAGGTLNRTLAAAASSSQRVLGGSYQSRCGRITTEAHETEEARLVVEVSTTDESVAFVALSWSLVDNDGVANPFRLVSPLAKTRTGWAVSYDLGDVTAVAAISIDAAEAISVSNVDSDDVTATFALGLLGSAMRAWRRVCGEGVVNDDLARVVRAKLADV
jgi:hypothetical protein